MKTYKLSASSLSLFNDCPKCFWLEKNKWLKRPKGIFPSLPSGMDNKIKIYFDKYRKEGKLPPELEGSGITSLYNDVDVINKWRDWKTTDLTYTNKEGHNIIGALDDCVMIDDELCPLDYKTRGSMITYNPAKYYKTQLNIYGLMLHNAVYKVGRYGYLLYYWPLEAKPKGVIKFEVQLYKVELDIEQGRQLFGQAIKVLQGKCPDNGNTCEYCQFYTNRVKQDFRKGDL